MLKQLLKMIKNPYMLSMVSKVFSVLVGFLFTIFQSRYLGAEIKGQVATVNSMVGITSVIFGLGVYYAYPYFKRSSKVDILPIFMKISCLMLAVYGAIAAGAVLLLDLSPKNVAVCLLTPLLAYDGIISYVTLIEKPNRRSVTDMASNLAELLLLVVLWLVAPPTFAIGVIIIVAKDVTKSILFTFWWRKRIFAPSESLRVWIPKIVKFGFFPMLSVLMTTLNYRIGVLMLNGQVEDAAIGVYSVGVLLAERIWMIPDAMKGVMTSKLTKGKDAKETTYVIRICNTVCLVIVLGLILLGEPFIDLAFGAEYEGAYQVTLILLVGVFTMIYYKLIAAYNIAMGKQIVSFCLLGVGVLIGILANLILIPRFGIYGAGISSVMSYGVCSVLFVVYFCRVTKLPFRTMLFLNRSDYQRLKAKFRKAS